MLKFKHAIVRDFYGTESKIELTLSEAYSTAASALAHQLKIVDYLIRTADSSTDCSKWIQNRAMLTEAYHYFTGENYWEQNER